MICAFKYCVCDEVVATECSCNERKNKNHVRKIADEMITNLCNEWERMLNSTVENHLNMANIEHLVVF